MEIEVLGPLFGVQTIATGRAIREFERLVKVYGPGRWRKRKGVTKVRMPDGAVCIAEVHWYEAHGVGSEEFKVKRILGEPR